MLTKTFVRSVEDIEKCKNRDMLEQILEELAGEYPAFREVLLDERDIYLTNTLQTVAKLTPKSGKLFFLLLFVLKLKTTIP